ncbi:hypothetical protein [Streptomyces avicenniae]|uniref:hypothetical protein n=1 Tax=Streptomyces avicenniae TaxID=500153 RepID=UPI000AED6558|nr:hypothetical protein [Streptomyces avicenniae]
MTHSHLPAPPASLAAVLERADADPGVAGVLLSGSRAHEGMATVHSDDDVHVVTHDGVPSSFDGLDGHRSRDLDLVVMPLSAFRVRGLPGDPMSWARYAYVHAVVLRDRLDGGIATLLDRKRALDAEEAREEADGHLDAFTNSAYRAMKSERDGRPEAARLDAAEAVPYALDALFALHRRVRPYNKFLRWELEHHPLGDPLWSADQLVPRLLGLAAEGGVGRLRALFRDVERTARAAGHGAVLDAWGDDLALLR